jgi:alpha-glucosidase
MRPLRRATLRETTERGVILDCGDAISCRISVLGEHLVRVLFLHDDAPRLRRTWMVPAHGADDVPWEGRDRLDESSFPIPPMSIEPLPDRITLATPALRLQVRLDPFGLTWSLPDGRVFARDRDSQPYLFGRARTEIRHYLARERSDRYFGAGDKTGRLDLHGRRLRIAMLDSLGYDPESGDPLYKHWPFVIARDGNTGTSYGTFYDNGASGALDLGAEHDNYFGPYRSYEARDGDLDCYMMLGPRLGDVTARFLDLTGRTALPPRWTLGYAQTTMALADAPDAQAQIGAFIDRCAAEDIPVSSFHFGSGYTSIGPKRYVFHWNRRKFPEPEALMQRFHAAGMMVVANLKPCLLDDHPRYAQALAAGAFVRDAATGEPVISQFWDGEGAHLDFTSRAGIAWWQDGLQKQVLEPGIDVGWNDNNEYGLWDEEAECDGFGDPVPLELVRGVQPLLMTRATLERQRQVHPDRRPFTITRAGCPGVQRYAQSWSGDNTTSWATLKWNLRTGLTMSLSGMFNTGHDIGGFAGPIPEPELLIRWVQAGLLHPRFIMNSWKPDGVFNSPWLHAQALPAIRDAIRLRYRLIPYLYSLMHQATDQHAPVLRPTFLEFQDDPRCFEDCDELMLGPFLLGAPVVQAGQRARPLYLPEGPEGWFDFHTEERLQAGTDAMLAAPLDRLPLAVPVGAILPMTDAAEDFSRLHDEPSRWLRLFPGIAEGASRFTLVEDDGVSADGPRSMVDCALSWTPEEVHLHVDVSGDYALPYDEIRVTLPRADRRPLVLTCNEPGLILKV